ncbi:MAG: hypothetical protein EPO51_09805 [Phenylobacterium sp.]|nr:MAG: hypothetical protein EPO51_09805 [Phenylobacterium sp.]
MRLLHLAVVLTLLTPAIGHAQDTPQKMLDLARQIRAQAAQMKDSLPPEDVADLIRQAEEIEQGVKDGGYSAPVAPEPVSLAKRIAEAHGGRLDWLARETACVGYSWENHRTFVSNYGDPRRDALCRTAYGHYAEYFRIARDGGGTVRSDPPLAAYDKAAQAAVDYYERK